MKYLLILFVIYLDSTILNLPTILTTCHNIHLDLLDNVCHENHYKIDKLSQGNNLPDAYNYILIYVFFLIHLKNLEKPNQTLLQLTIRSQLF